MQVIKNLYASIISYFNRKKYQEAIKDSAISAVLSSQLLQNSTTLEWKQIPKHVLHKPSIDNFKKQIKQNGNGLETINFGDSLTALSYEWFDEIDGKFAISGSWHKHMDDVAGELFPLLQDKQIKYVAVGTLGGNPLLVYQDWERTVEYSIKVLNRIRELFPLAKIIVYGLPPVYNIHATSHTAEFDKKLIDWVSRDPNGVFIELKSKFGGFFPKAKWSSDGVHLTPSGATKLNLLIKEAKKTKEKVI